MKAFLKKNKTVVIAVVGVVCLLAAAAVFLIPRIGEGEAASRKDIQIATSAAIVSETGFCTDISSVAEPKDVITSGDPQTVIAYAKITDLDIATSVNVNLTAPDGTITKDTAIPTNQDGYVFIYYKVEQPGDYTVSWTIPGKTAATSMFTVNG